MLETVDEEWNGGAPLLAHLSPDGQEAFFVLLLAPNKTQETLFSAFSISQVSLHVGPLPF